MKNKKTIVFRVDASREIGWGHLMRELAVAERLKKEGNIIIFSSIKDFSNEQIKKAGFRLFLKKKQEGEERFLNRLKNTLNPEIIVFDGHLQYNSAFLKSWKGKKIKVVMIDNLCQGLKAADEIIFPVVHLDRELLKKFLSPKERKRVISGFDYVILAKEILRTKSKRTVFHNPPNIVLITGGTDPEGVLLKILSWLKEITLKANIFALFGKGFSFPEKLREIKRDLPLNFRILPYSWKEIVKADIAICTFGQSIYELIYLQIPTICLSHSKENARAAKILKNKGLIEDMGYFKQSNCQLLSKALGKLLNKRYRQKMVQKYQGLIDGKGAERLAKIIEI